jgi:hypothetical protein
MIEQGAMCCLNHAPASLLPYQANYCQAPDHVHQCKGCRHFDANYDALTDAPGAPMPAPKCRMFEELNAKTPLLFDLNVSIDRNAGCVLWTEPEKEEAYG